MFTTCTSGSGGNLQTQRFAALRHRDFRLYWIGLIVSISGQQMLWMLEPWLIYEISGSKAALGLNALAQAVPATALVLLGGVIADKFDQRKLLIAMQASSIALLAILAILALTETLELWHIFAVAFVHSAVGSFENPARQSMFPHLVPREAMSNAVALNSAIHPATRIGAPVVGGFILAMVMAATDSARIAAGIVILITIAGIGVYILTLLMVRMPPVTRARSGSVMENMAEGVRFIRRNRVFSFIIGIAYYHMFFGVSMYILFPVIAKDVLQVGPDVLGVMWAAMGAGSLAGVMVASNLSQVSHQRYLLTGGQLLLGIAMIGFALTPIYWLSLALLFLAGLGSSAFNVSNQQNLQLLVPNQFRGRVMGVWSIVHSSVRPLGEMQFSGLAAVVAAPLAIVFGGAMIVGSAIFWTVYSAPMHALMALREQSLAEPAERHR
jgi:MFS family permease